MLTGKKAVTKEIGSDFWDVSTINNAHSLFSTSVQWFLSGRVALQAIIKGLKGKKTVAIPSWCCDSMVKPFTDGGMEVRFYPVYYRNGLIQDIHLNCDILLVMDYFGYTGTKVDLSCYDGIVIRDVTHSFFSKTYSDADYYFGSLRKWCGVWTGGYAWTDNNRQMLTSSDGNDNGYTNLRKIAMKLKSCYINKTQDDNGNLIKDKSYLSIYNEAEEILENVDIASASERDIVLAHKLDVDYIKTQRRTNAQILMHEFAEQTMFSTLNKDDCPLFVPVLVPYGKRDELRRYLIQHDIYCPVHWPISNYHVLDEKTKVIYDNELSLVCDQRYTEEDMYRIVDTIKDFWRGN